MDFNKKALEEVDYLTQQLSEIDDEQAGLEKKLMRHKINQTLSNPTEIYGVKRGKNPFPQKAIENQKKIAIAAAELDLLNKEMEDIEKTQKKAKVKIKISQLEEALKTVKKKSRAAVIRERITALKNEYRDNYHEPVHLSQNGVKHTPINFVKWIKEIVKEKLMDPNEIKEPELRPPSSNCNSTNSVFFSEIVLTKSVFIASNCLANLSSSFLIFLFKDY